MELQSLCPWCGKQCHMTRAAALASVRRRQRRDARVAQRLRACCTAAHVTACSLGYQSGYRAG
jgi:hypothetical protein